MAYNYEWPYVDPNRHNSDWELNKVKELDARVTAAEQEIAEFEEAMKNDWADYQDKINGQIDDFTGGMISQWNDYKQEMNQSWTSYQNNLNASWAAYQTKLNGDWDAYKTQMGTDWANYQQSINAQWAQYKTDTDTDIATWKAGAINDLNAWKTATTADLTAWKQQANTDIANWEATTSASLDADFAQYRQTTDSAITAWETATSANLNKLLDDYKALINGEWAQYKTDIAAFKSSVNVSLSGMDSRITAMQTAINTLQSDWATFQTTIQGDITTFENSVNSALSSMRQDMTDFESDLNAKISTQNAQIASMQTALNNIPTTVNAAVDNKFNSLKPPYMVVGIMWQNYHEYIKKTYSGITNATLITCGNVSETAIDRVILDMGVTVARQQSAANYFDLNSKVSDNTFKIIMIANDFVGAVNQWGPRYIQPGGPTVVVRDYGSAVSSSVGTAHAILILCQASAFYGVLNDALVPARIERVAYSGLNIMTVPGDCRARVWGSIKSNTIVSGFPVSHTTKYILGYNTSSTPGVSLIPLNTSTGGLDVGRTTSTYVNFDYIFNLTDS